MKSKISLRIAKATANEVVAKAATIVSKMTDNPNFSSPIPELSSIAQQADVVKDKLTRQQAAFQTYQQMTAELKTEKEKLMSMLETEAAYVQITSVGDEATILSSGFDIRQKAVAIGKLPPAKKLLVFEGMNEGEVNATWDPVKGARSYLVEMSTDITRPEAWVYQTTTTRGKCTLQGLPSGSRIWIRVAPINAAGQGAYSDPATKTVP